MTIPREAKEWLLAAPEPYILYQAQRLLDPDTADPSLLDRDPFIKENLAILADWNKEVLARHDKADLFIHRLAMLADLGVAKGTKGATRVVESLLKNIKADGSFPIDIMIPTAFGGSGAARRDWIICDFPVILYALALMAPGDPRLEPAIEKLMALAGDRYYPCCGSIPRFKGPGPRNGMCPYANLLVARALSAHPEARKSPAARIAAMAVLDHWTNRKEKKPFLFGMGTDFMKLKFPMVWYNVLHVLHGLKGVEKAPSDSRYLEIAKSLAEKMDETGRARPESAYQCYRGNEWSDKKNPSRLITILSYSALKGLRFPKEE